MVSSKNTGFSHNPWQSEQLPAGELNEKLEISNFAGICPQLEQTKILEYFFDIFFSQTIKSRLSSQFPILKAKVKLSLSLFISRFSGSE